MLGIVVLLLTLAADPLNKFTSPRDARPEYPASLKPVEVREGFVCLFDESRAAHADREFGWVQGMVRDGELVQGESTTEWGEVKIRILAGHPGTLLFGDLETAIPEGMSTYTLSPKSPSTLKLAGGLTISVLLVEPLQMESILSPEQMGQWKPVRHPRLPDSRQTNWSFKEGVLLGRGGPGAMEFDRPVADLVLRVQVRTRATRVNGGVFLRSIPGDFMNGYEAQVFNACYEEDPAKPARYSTGAIDDRQMARRLVSRDLEPFTMTVHLSGAHLATWVNGIQMTDWTDTRPEHLNPRMGLRTQAGTLQLQAHDPETDIEFLEVKMRALR